MQRPLLWTAVCVCWWHCPVAARALPICAALAATCSDIRDSGQWDRWVSVQLTYCTGAERTWHIYNQPSAMLQLGGHEHLVLEHVKALMRSFKVGDGGWLYCFANLQVA